MTTTHVHATKKNPRVPALDRAVAKQRAATEYDRVVTLLAELTPEQWSARTDCTEWDVRAMAGHMLGMVQMVSSIPETLRQQAQANKRTKRDGGEMIDSLTALQVEKNQHLTTDQLFEEYRRLAPKAVRFRSRAPRFIRSQTLPNDDEWWTMGYLFDVILTRDPFLHRVDICGATGAQMTATADHEGVIVDDVVREWAGRHGSDYDLELTGPAGGRWQRGQAERLTIDAFEFCRALSGRAPASGLLETQVPF